MREIIKTMEVAVTTNIKSLAEEDRPREKAVKYGLMSLTDTELIAILLGSGSRNESAVQLARRIYASCGNDVHKFARLSTKRLQNFRGVGEAKAVTLTAALELGRRRMHVERNKEPQISSSSDAYELMAPILADKPCEEVWLIMMNQAGRVVMHDRVSSGGMTGTVVDPKVVMRMAIENHATRIILVHNHPSGTCRPSLQDAKLTQKIKHGAILLDIDFADHIIIAGDRFFSFLDEGML